MNYYAVFGVVIFFVIGYIIDQRIQTGYTCALIGLFLGISLVVYEVWKVLRKK